MASIQIIPSAEYPAGVYEFFLTKIPSSAEGAKATLTRDAWPEGPIADIGFYYSADDGVTWHRWCGASLSGGTVIGKDGNPATVSTVGCEWPGEAGPNGRVKLKGADVKVVMVSLQVFTTTITLETI